MIARTLSSIAERMEDAMPHSAQNVNTATLKVMANPAGAGSLITCTMGFRLISEAKDLKTGLTLFFYGRQPDTDAFKRRRAHKVF